MLDAKLATPGFPFKESGKTLRRIKFGIDGSSPDVVPEYLLEQQWSRGHKFPLKTPNDNVERAASKHVGEVSL